jgi:hypothetical protein
MNIDKIETNKNLISIGNEIISSNSSQKLNSNTPRRIHFNKEIKDEINIKTIKPYNSINTFRSSNLSTTNDLRKKTLFNLSKLNYKDGLILKDATNSNPGFGLWSIKLSQSLKNSQLKNEEKNSNRIYFNGSKINYEIKEENSDSDNSDILINPLENNSAEEQVDKIIINRLTKRSKKLEKKYKNLLTHYYEKENEYLGLERARKEYEQLINKSIKEKKDEEIKLNNLDNNNQALIVSISNARKEIERLVIVIKESQSNIKKEMEEYNNILRKEEEKRQKIINAIKVEEKQYIILREKINEDEEKINLNSPNNNDINNNNNNEIEKEKALKKKKDMERENNINKKKEYIKELQKQIEQLNIIYKEKQQDKKDLFEKIKEKNNDKKKNMKSKIEIFKELERQEINNRYNEQAIKIRKNIIEELKK